MKLIELTKGKKAIVDAKDYESLSQFKWHTLHVKSRGLFYAIRSNYSKGGKITKIYMHRVITGCPAGMLVDHKNHDGLDNRRTNLRICTRGDNQRNQRPQKGRSSQFRGVSKCYKKWSARIWFKNKEIQIGQFYSEMEAARAYDEKAKELHGEFATLNFR